MNLMYRFDFDFCSLRAHIFTSRRTNSFDRRDVMNPVVLESVPDLTTIPRQNATLGQTLHLFNHDISHSYAPPIRLSQTPSTRKPTERTLIAIASVPDAAGQLSLTYNPEVASRIDTIFRLYSSPYSVDIPPALWSMAIHHHIALDPSYGTPINCEAAQQASTILDILQSLSCIFRHDAFWQRPIPYPLKYATGSYAGYRNPLSASAWRNLVAIARNEVPQLADDFAESQEPTNTGGLPDALFKVRLTHPDLVGTGLSSRWHTHGIIAVEEKIGIPDGQFIALERCIASGNFSFGLDMTERGAIVNSSAGISWADRLAQVRNLYLLPAVARLI